MMCAMRSLLLLVFLMTAASAATLTERLHTAASATATMRLSFVQAKHLTLFDETITTPGVIEIDRTHARLRWEFTDRAVFIFADDRLRKWGADGREETGLDRDPNLTALRAQMRALISGDWRTVEDLFTVTAQGNALTLTPRDGALTRFVDRLEITFSADLTAPETLNLIAASGDETTYRFAAAETGIDLDASRFAGP